ncbi:unnamed protein product [Rotaria sordida]|uniref:Uncharacterized protein n=1 Tax=Rotaria sordida TaxID=392033 RepID=A0A814HZ25_9BILA|nr:unnamed protein product [Rotaria sordida]CAF4054835.1 unnamed protein product [Rotaria sordida]
MNNENNDLWSYSAKIFTIIDNKLDLTSILKENLGILPSKNEFEQLNQSLEITNNSKRDEKFNIAQMISLIAWIKYNAQLQPMEFDGEALQSLLDADPCQTTRELAE